MIVVNIHEAKTNFSKLVDQAHNGNEVIVAKAGKPWARLVPLEKKPERVPGRYHDGPGDDFFKPLPEDELQAWES
jgi:prevent-host-death family protein